MDIYGCAGWRRTVIISTSGCMALTTWSEVSWLPPGCGQPCLSAEIRVPGGRCKAVTTPPQKHFHPLTSSTGDKGTARSWRLRRGFGGGGGWGVRCGGGGGVGAPQWMEWSSWGDKHVTRGGNNKGHSGSRQVRIGNFRKQTSRLSE